MRQTKLKKEGKIYKFINISSLLVLVFNMSFGMFFIAPKVSAQVAGPYISVQKSATTESCEQADITLSIKGDGEPINQRKPIDVVFVIDRSASMGSTTMPVDYLSKVKTATKSFIDKMFKNSSEDRVSIISYAGYSSDAATINYPLGSNQDDAKSAVDAIEATGGTCIECGLKAAYSQLGDTDREQFVILLSDGVANVKYPGTLDSSLVCNSNNYKLIDCPIQASTCTDNAVTVGESIKTDFPVKIYSIGYRLGDMDLSCNNSGDTSALAASTLRSISSNPADYYFSGDLDNINSVFDTIAWQINSVAGYDAKITEVLPEGVTYSAMISGPEPSTINGQILTWEFGTLRIDETREVKFSVTTDPGGHSGLIDDYPDTALSYLDYSDKLNIVPFPETSLNIASCGPTLGNIYGCKWEDDGDAIYTVGELLMGDWEIGLYDQAGALLATTTTVSADTAELGCYRFNNIPFGTYILKETLKDNWTQVYPGATASVPYAHQVTLSADSACAQDLHFGNVKTPTPSTYKISGYKYLDQDGTTTTDEYLQYPGADWVIELYTSDIPVAVATTTTDANGYFEFNNVVSGIYRLSELIFGNWINLVRPETFTIDASDKTDNIFVNYEKSTTNAYCGDGSKNQESEECDDGDEIDDNACSNDCQLNSYCGDGIVDEGEKCDDGELNGTRGYCNDKCSGRLSSGGSSTFIPEKKRIIGTSTSETETETETPDDTEVLGEEGVPVLSIVKKIKQEFANPGDVLDYVILVSNSGKLAAFNAVVKDHLPDGFSFVDNGSASRTWELGDLKAGEGKELSYQVKVGDKVSAETYVNTATLSADNHAAVSDTAEVEIRQIMVLAETGFRLIEFITLSLFSLAAFFMSRRMRRGAIG